MSPRALVLGCGPAGLFAVHALTTLGFDVSCVSKKRRSEMYGAQHLFQPIPGITDDQQPFKVSYALTGTWDDYRLKVYGPDDVYGDNEATSGTYEAWDIRAAYHAAWRLYGDSVTDVELGPVALGDLLLGRRPHVVVSTVPAPTLCCFKGHSFRARDAWAIGDAPERGIFAPRIITEDNTIAYDGTKERGWYRASMIAGYHTVEWPSDLKPPISNVATVTKPIWTDCDCWVSSMPQGTFFWRVGRYGSWSRRTFAHEGYTAVRRALEGVSW